MKKIFFFLLICAQQTFAQNSTQVPLTYYNNYAQPAPTVASLAKFADYPVSYYTGVPRIDVPLYTLKDGSFNIPVSLSYHASGIRVSEQASWVGLGWAFNAGGVIARTVRGAPDEGTQTGPFTTGLNGYYISGGIRNLPLLPNPNQSGSENYRYNNFFIPEVIEGSIDTEPDLFTFNFNGHTGKFVFDEYKTPKLLTDDNIKITPILANNKFSWMITTEDGLQYYFGENDTKEVTYTAGSNNNGKAPSSWYLTRIVNPNTKETATFSYVRETYYYNDFAPEMAIYAGNNSALDNPSYACDLSNIQLGILVTSVFGWRLSGIQTTNYSINFIANTQRQDLNGGYHNDPGVSNWPPGPKSANSLDSILVYSGQNCLKRFAFAYNYFVSPENTTSPNVVTRMNSDGYVPLTDTKRLKLLSVTETDGAGIIKNPPFTFTYNEAQSLPRRLSFDQDHWGFYNLEYGSYRNTMLTPPTGNQGFCNGATYGTDRNSRWPYMSAFTLIGVNTPLGANTVFQYEPNSDGDDVPSQKRILGGLRIARIQTTDNVTGLTITRKFNYGGGAILYKNPELYYFTRLNNEFFRDPGQIQQGAGYMGYSSTNILFGAIRQATSIVPLQDPQGNHIGYPRVKELYGINGENGYVLRTYSVAQSPNANASRLPFGTYTQFYNVPGFPGYYGNGQFNQISLDNVPYYSSYTPTLYYPLTPMQVDITRGNLLTQATYDAANTLLDSTTNVYGETLHKNYLIRGFKAFRITTGYSSSGSAVIQDALAFYKLHTGISHLISTTTTSYRNNQQFTTLTKYGYESPNHTLVTSDTTYTSSGLISIGKHYYSFDYANDVFNKMKIRNLLLPVSERKWKDGQLVGGTITVYKDFATILPDTLIYPEKVYRLETVSPLTTTQAGENPTWVDQQTTLLPNSYYKEKANFINDWKTGKGNQQQQTGGLPVSYQWGYKNTFPVVRIINAVNTYQRNGTSTPGTAGTGLILQKGSTQTYTSQFNIQALGNTIIDISFHSNPGTNVVNQVSALLNGPNGYSSNLTLCLSNGTASCGNYSSGKSISNLPPGNYTISANFYQSQNVIADTYLTVSYPVLSTTPSGIKEFYYQGFEDNADDYQIVSGIAHTGSKFTTKDTLNWTRPNTRDYVISYWYRSSNKWILKPEQPYVSPSFTLTGGDAYDDIRIYPKDAQMTTYTYEPLVGMTSMTDAKGQTTYYEYDSFQRLLNIKDLNKNILKNYKYNYSTPAVWNEEQFGYFNKSCSTGTGTSVKYTVAAHTYSAGSLSAANALAQADVAANGQANANADPNATCQVLPYALIEQTSVTTNGDAQGYANYRIRLYTDNTYTTAFTATSNITVNFRVQTSTSVNNGTPTVINNNYTASVSTGSSTSNLGQYENGCGAGGVSVVAQGTQEKSSASAKSGAETNLVPPGGNTTCVTKILIVLTGTGYKLPGA